MTAYTRSFYEGRDLWPDKFDTGDTLYLGLSSRGVSAGTLLTPSDTLVGGIGDVGEARKSLTVPAPSAGIWAWAAQTFTMAASQSPRSFFFTTSSAIANDGTGVALFATDLVNPDNVAEWVAAGLAGATVGQAVAIGGGGVLTFAPTFRLFDLDGV